MASFGNHGVLAPARAALVWAPNDDDEIEHPVMGKAPTRQIRVTQAGNLAVQMEKGEDVVIFPGLAANETLLLSVRKVMETGTTVGSVIILF